MPLIIPSNTITGGYEVDNSLRFDDGSSDYLNRTPASAGNRKTWTFSSWVKRGNLSGVRQGILTAASSGSIYWGLEFDANDKLNVFDNVGISQATTSAVYRDISAWYHIVVAIDTTNATAADRFKLYVNGERISDWSTSPSTITLNADLRVNLNIPHSLGSWEPVSGLYFDGYMAETVLIDGQQLDPTSFGEFDEDSGIWKPINVSGLTFGTNGFYLPFKNSAALGQDDSGNGNNFTVNNLTSIDQTTDTPTNNFCTLNPLNKGSNVTLSEGNTKATCSLTADDQTYGTMGFNTGKWYWEIKYNSVNASEGGAYIGFARIGLSSGSTVLLSQAGTLFRGTASGTAPSGFTNGDILGLAVDADNLRWYIYKNGSANGDYVTFTNDTGDFIIPFQGNNDYNLQANFGNPSNTISSGNSDANGYGNFEYLPPSGYLALCTANLATDG